MRRNLWIMAGIAGAAGLWWLAASPLAWGKGRQPVGFDVVTPTKIGRGWRRG